MENLRARRQAHLEAENRRRTIVVEQVKEKLKEKLNEARDTINKDDCRAAFETKFIETGSFDHAQDMAQCKREVEPLGLWEAWFYKAIDQWERDNPGFSFTTLRVPVYGGYNTYRHVHMTLQAFPEFSEK